MECNYLAFLEGELGIGSTLIVTKLNLEYPRGEEFDNCTYLAPIEASFRKVLEQCNCV